MKIKAGNLKEFLEPVNTLVTECKARISEDGIKITAVDPAHIAMIDIEGGKELFEEGELQNGEFGINLSSILDIIKLVKPDTILDIELSEDAAQMSIKFENGERKTALLDYVAFADPKIPPLTPSAQVEVSGDDVDMGARVAANIFDLVTLRLDPEEGFTIESASDGAAGAWRVPKENLLSVEVEERVQSSYAMDYFLGLVKAVKGSSISLAFGKDYPLMVMFQKNDDKIKGTYLLAPRIEND